MKAVIIDVKRRRSAAMDETGRIIYLPGSDYIIGQSVELGTEKKVGSKALKRMTAAAIAAAMVLCIGLGIAYALPYGTVTLEGANTVTYTINYFDIVIDVDAAQEQEDESCVSLDEKSLCHCRIDKAVASTIRQLGSDSPEYMSFYSYTVEAQTMDPGRSEDLEIKLQPFLSGIPFNRTEGPRMDMRQ